MTTYGYGETEYAICRTCGQMVQRIHGIRHGDGQTDTDDNPVWLTLLYDDVDVDTDDISSIAHCGCND